MEGGREKREKKDTQNRKRCFSSNARGQTYVGVGFQLESVQTRENEGGEIFVLTCFLVLLRWGLLLRLAWLGFACGRAGVRACGRACVSAYDTLWEDSFFQSDGEGEGEGEGEGSRMVEVRGTCWCLEK